MQLLKKEKKLLSNLTIPQIKVPTITIASTSSLFTDSQIDDLFGISGLFKNIKRKIHKSEVKRLENLPLSFSECKTLFQDKKISIDHLESYINELGMTVDQILFLRGTHNLYPFEVKSLLELNVSICEIKELMQKGLTQNEIKDLIGQKSQTPAVILQLLGCISKSELISLDASSFAFISNIRQICRKEHNNIDVSLQSYEILYNSIPSLLVDDAIKSTNKVLALVPVSGLPFPASDIPNTNTDSMSLEEILKFYMDLASGKTIEGIGNIPAIFNITMKIIDKITDSKNSEIVKLFPIRPYMLAVIWIAMIVNIEKKHVDVIDISMKEIAKAIMSILFALLTGVTGFFHSGGTGMEIVNITAYIASYYKIQETIKQNCKKIYSKIPDKIKFKTDDSFDKLSSEMQLSAGRALSMTYTFRIGDNMITSLVDENVFSINAAKKAFKSMWPLPMSSESKRMYFLYSGYSIYTNFDMTDIFVRVPENFV